MTQEASGAIRQYDNRRAAELPRPSCMVTQLGTQRPTILIANTL
jgi:hypothetical protein